MEAEGSRKCREVDTSKYSVGPIRSRLDTENVTHKYRKLWWTSIKPIVPSHRGGLIVVDNRI